MLMVLLLLVLLLRRLLLKRLRLRLLVLALTNLFYAATVMFFLGRPASLVRIILAAWGKPSRWFGSWRRCHRCRATSLI